MHVQYVPYYKKNKVNITYHKGNRKKNKYVNTFLVP